MRITPAYAGKTYIMLMIAVMSKDHPRIRGKDNLIIISSKLILGSPPHTRERQEKAKETINTIRITPAYAGKTDFTET